MSKKDTALTEAIEKIDIIIKDRRNFAESMKSEGWLVQATSLYDEVHTLEEAKKEIIELLPKEREDIKEAMIKGHYKIDSTPDLPVKVSDQTEIIFNENYNQYEQGK